MYVCVCEHARSCVYMHAYAYVFYDCDYYCVSESMTSVFVFLCAVCLCVCIYMCAFVRVMYVCMCVCMCVRARACACTYARVFVSARHNLYEKGLQSFFLSICRARARSKWDSSAARTTMIYCSRLYCCQY